MATTTARPTARRSVRSRKSALTVDGRTPRVDSIQRPLLLRGGFRLAVDKALNLPDRVVDLDVELHLAERRRRAACVAGDAVVLPRRGVGIRRLSALTARAGRRRRVAFSRRNQLLADPPLVAAEIQ